jgi:hypothetical protein
LRNFGLKVGVVGTVKFEARIKELVENLPDLAVLVEPLLMVRRVLRDQFSILHHRLMAIVRDDEVCRSAKWSWLKAWAMKIARQRRMKKAIVALARQLAVIMHRIWVDGTEFRWTRESQQRKNRAGSNAIGGKLSSTERWKDVPRGTMDEVSSLVCLDRSFV